MGRTGSDMPATAQQGTSREGAQPQGRQWGGRPQERKPGPPSAFTSVYPESCLVRLFPIPSPNSPEEKLQGSAGASEPAWLPPNTGHSTQPLRALPGLCPLPGTRALSASSDALTLPPSPLVVLDSPLGPRQGGGAPRCGSQPQPAAHLHFTVGASTRPLGEAGGWQGCCRQSPCPPPPRLSSFLCP